MTPTRKTRRSPCPLNATLEALGDHWSLLIVRDLLFFDRRTFKDFQDAGERIATNILTDRLRRLEDEGIITRRRAPEDARRFTYALTLKGRDLAALMVEMIVWGARYHDTAAPPAMIREMTRNREQVVARLRDPKRTGPMVSPRRKAR